MCNLYSQLRSADSIRAAIGGGPLLNLAGNLEPGDIYPDRLGPIVTLDEGELALHRARWGMPSPRKYHSKSGIDRGVTNIRNTSSSHWRRWLGPEHRCLVPFDRFAEPRPGKGAGNAWFAPVDHEVGFFAGVWVSGWRSMRKLKDGETVDDLYAFLTTEANGVVGPVHPKAMPVILLDAADLEAWLNAPWDVAQHLQRPLADGELVLVEDHPQRRR